VTLQPPIGEQEARAGVRAPVLARAIPTMGRDAAIAVALALVIITYGNLVSLPPDGVRTGFGWAFVSGSLGFLALLVLWAVRVGGMPLSTLGIISANAGRSALVGAALGAVVILPVVLYFAFPLGLDNGIDPEGVREETWGGFLSWALVHQPLGTSLFEEVLFRGVLLAKMTVAWGQRQALVASSLTFALWHLVINFRTIHGTEVLLLWPRWPPWSACSWAVSSWASCASAPAIWLAASSSTGWSSLPCGAPCS
jgi:membrane protease YdiL (CAAX protease family)